MDHEFWHERWRLGETAFHEPTANRMLVANHERLPPGRIFVPLCGKTRDIAFLLGTGREIVGVELSRTAIEELFQELGVEPTITKVKEFERFSADGIDVFVGDVFALTSETIGPVDAVYDRAALVALPADLRERYAALVAGLGVPQLVVTFDYDQGKMEGPPFSIDESQMKRLYGATFSLQQLDCKPMEGGLKGVPADEVAWLLQS